MWIQGVVLEHHRQIALPRFLVGDVLTAEEYAPVRDRFQAGDHPENRRLAAPGRTDENNELTVLDGKRYFVDSRHIAAVDLGDVV